MKPKGKLFALVAIFAAIGLVTATGAFTTVAAERTATVDVANDADALLQMQPADTPNGNEYAATSGGQIEVDLSSGGLADASGINKNALTDLDYVFNITNQGTQEVRVWIEHTTPGSVDDGTIVIYNGTNPSANEMEASNDPGAPVLGSGDRVSVGIQFDLTSTSPGDFTVDLTVNADANEV